MESSGKWEKKEKWEDGDIWVYVRGGGKNKRKKKKKTERKNNIKIRNNKW